MSITSETIFFGDAQRSTTKASQVKVIHTPHDLTTCEPGQLLQRWDFISRYNDDCLPLSMTDPLRHRSDPLSDDVVDLLDLKPGQDGLKAVEEYFQREGKAVSAEDEKIPEPIRKFWQEVHRRPPNSISGFVEGETEDNPRQLVEAMKNHDRIGKGRIPSLAEGQAVFWRYSAPIFVALMHFTLAGGFSAPHLSATMKETNYLTSKSRDASYRRLVETSLMVLDCMSDMTIDQGIGWKSAIRVRLLHAQVRRRIRLGQGRLNAYSVEEHGIPINQYDLAIVLGGFMIAPLWSLRRVGLHLTPFESAAYVRAWTHVGFYLGIDDSLLERMYGRTYATAETSFAWLAFPAFPSEVPEDGYSTPAHRILSAVSGRPPAARPVGHHRELSRMLLGTRLADQLALPRGTRTDWFTSRYETSLSTAFILFGRYWPRKQWEEERQAWFGEVMYLITLYHLGEKRTTFAWREEGRHEHKLGEGEGEEAGMSLGPAVWRETRRRWIRLVGEMVGGTVLVLGTVLVGGWKVWSRTLS
ncbi:BZ3500_MvSof-1268-A1-R1_Chr6-3g08804 [Microbotryum saponariae]|uniref:BZ3500_MvSof-1268-A1-R1_Chr6-3g08804 protein n=1 Tax=Microbotryum saponariae TaxID=289078 RepID=A0A2X0LCN8_9BASI|nr:BZ3500_MvSof-1268-A1-R1_Chr6-3g08804 [Microbotryum saponariae]SDA07405.1 BZ3501_MvSof-1269-A2-R1_Chr6-2g08507 [Microbotryum saponariae]